MTPGIHNGLRTDTGRRSGLTLLELVIALAIVSLIAAIAVPEYQRYILRAKAAGIVIDSAPIIRAIQEFQQGIDKSRNRILLVNGTDGSIAGCQVPAGSTCSSAGAVPVVVVRPELLLIAVGTVRVSAAPCHVDCPGFALDFSSDLAVPGTATPPAATADPVPSDPGNGQKKDAGGKGKKSALDAWPGQGALAWLGESLVPGAHAVTPAAAAGATVEQTNRVLYEFGESMRQKAYASDNAACLFSTGACTVTIKYR